MASARWTSDFNTSALVLFSGGQDSATCLAWALERYERVETIGFAYGQRHVIELACREHFRKGIQQQFPHWAHKLGQDHMLDLSLLGQISDTALTEDKAIEMQQNGLPNTFVPGRNLLFLTFAATIAYRRQLKMIVGGMCETDYSGYPDCRPEYLRAFEAMANLATKAAVEGRRIEVRGPLVAEVHQAMGRLWRRLPAVHGYQPQALARAWFPQTADLAQEEEPAPAKMAAPTAMTDASTPAPRTATANSASAFRVAA